MSDLIDTTEMYLRTVYELLEEGIPPLRARIAERLHQSGPTVSQTVGRMERDGLLVVDEDRTIKLTRTGAKLARDVMRKHRLAECLLTEVIGLEWEKVHDEACRWEHVISLDVEKRLVAILDSPTHSPYGNPIPGLHELGIDVHHQPFREGADPLTDMVTEEPQRFVLQRMSENLQADAHSLGLLARTGFGPDTPFEAVRIGDMVHITVGEAAVDVPVHTAELLFVSPE
ncbi:metal-dependent transcriptional regulator [Tessaracoccus sp. MC1865]|uniref:metal-dependent transcriptional regulator n=1 Tax=unclassified Tessaracoccus TaxID=2635419 RepID=UPI001601B5DE|nr:MULTISPECIES: metal-dependent transcriptional regulator [unclassified Tessaracoccus]MBB1482517.1 metal-dependent transcriptional regulator [Tessaracoccus sp. MC1865]MBB1509735.1 metal-dependent transcriptional regulator [Tessaracoccus sp. MC1756]QTO38028.1 metal-dependent transcriptional regulator [Tessaracoccus sp. MC1865]